MAEKPPLNFFAFPPKFPRNLNNYPYLFSLFSLELCGKKILRTTNHTPRTELNNLNLRDTSHEIRAASDEFALGFTLNRLLTCKNDHFP